MKFVLLFVPTGTGHPSAYCEAGKHRIFYNKRGEKSNARGGRCAEGVFHLDSWHSTDVTMDDTFRVLGNPKGLLLDERPAILILECGTLAK
jgi:hypothetical protein